MTPPPAGQDVKACCAAAYSSDAVALLLGDSYHPGGTTLTRRLADALALSPGERVRRWHAHSCAMAARRCLNG